METLQSERLQATLIAAALIVISVMIALFETVGDSEFTRMLRATNTLRWYLVFAFGMILYQLFVRHMIGRTIRRKGEFPNYLRYWNSFVETSLPTLVMIMLANALNPIYSLVSVASLVYFLFIVLSALRLNFWLCVFTGFVAASEYVTLALIYTAQSTDTAIFLMLMSPVYHGAKAVLLLVAGLSAGFVTLQIRKRILHSFETMEERNAAVRLFGQHVSPAVVDELMTNNADTSTTRKYVCVMFVDIRGFTTFAEKRSPDETLSYLNSMFGFMIESIDKHHGIVHQLLGDGLMAIFGAPMSFGNDSENAVLAATEIIDRIREEMTMGRIPPTRIGVGLHAGEVVAGSVGSSLHKEYKVTGDVVNVAARVEKLNKEFESQLLISGEVFRVMNNKRQAVSLGPVAMIGREEPVEIYMLAK